MGTLIGYYLTGLVVWIILTIATAMLFEEFETDKMDWAMGSMLIFSPLYFLMVPAVLPIALWYLLKRIRIGLMKYVLWTREVWSD